MSDTANPRMNLFHALGLVLVLLPFAYVLASGPMIETGRDDVYPQGERPESLWRAPWCDLFRPLHAVSTVPIVGAPLRMYWSHWTGANANTKFERVRDALTGAPPSPPYRVHDGVI